MHLDDRQVVDEHEGEGESRGQQMLQAQSQPSEPQHARRAAHDNSLLLQLLLLLLLETKSKGVPSRGKPASRRIEETKRHKLGVVPACGSSRAGQSWRAGECLLVEISAR